MYPVGFEARRGSADTAAEAVMKRRIAERHADILAAAVREGTPVKRTASDTPEVRRATNGQLALRK